MAQLKYHYFHVSLLIQSSGGRGASPSLLELSARTVPRRGSRRRRVGWARSALKTVSGGEFDWGGTSVKR